MATPVDIEEMERNATLAGKELEEMPDEEVTRLANWWKKWYRDAGHKRLGRRLLEHADK